ncbi:longistatin-like [Haemaphysalis longicornis]
MLAASKAGWWMHCTALLACMVGVVSRSEATPDQAPKPSSRASAEIYRKWSAAEVVRDLEHIKRDIAKIRRLQSAGEVTMEEAYFYYFRMHDFDNNNLLDGQEIKVAMMHIMHHQEDDHEELPVSDEYIARYVDSALQPDANNDGFISYPELRSVL